ncbi:MAG: hypothetical protein H8D45_22775 [Bacteroidetes bacterium]|nr:hypothetical protein [Bacteroidota bacterium]
MHTIKINDYKATVPGSWNELNKKQLFIIIRFFLLGLPEADFKLKTILTFLNIKILAKKPVNDPADNNSFLYVLHKNGYKNFLVAPDQLVEISNTLDFLFETITDEGEEIRIMNSHLSVNLLPKFTYKNKTFYGPADKLFNITFAEYIVAETNYLNFLKSKDELDLNKLVVTLYRFKDPEYIPDNVKTKGDPREQFNDHLIGRRAVNISKLNTEIKYAVFMFYKGCRNFIVKQFPAAHKPPKKKSSNNLGFLSLVDALTGGDVTKTDSVRKSYLYDVMVRLEQAAIIIEEIETIKTKK